MEELQGDACSICLEPLAPQEDGGDLSRTPCNHRFHQNCLKEWFIHGFPGHWCPLCKRHLHKVEQFDALFGGGTSNHQLPPDQLQTLLEQRIAEEEERFQVADQRVTEARANYNLVLERNLTQPCNWLRKDREELNQAVKSLEESKRQGNFAQGPLQVVARRRRQFDRDLKRYDKEKEEVANLKERHHAARKQMEEDSKLKEEQGRNFEEETSRYEPVLRRYEVAELILM